MDLNCSYPFTPMIVGKEVILRPLLQCVLSHGGSTFETFVWWIPARIIPCSSVMWRGTG
jgi:hypothetical protein